MGRLSQHRIWRGGWREGWALGFWAGFALATGRWSIWDDLKAEYLRVRGEP